ncbi:hypothetical protein AAFF_G00018440 [Aldrovandia affinis]|uniref:Integrase catalytic domain-containing protein n=1 Tax=Aldrovandia affinis TaxID=143900 RepID=A0AAD7R349_9TELE|nr:hypothetical protein AAFF_G00018440 [Aldrovandia affinis]
MPSVRFLGHIVSKDGDSTDPEKVRAMFGVTEQDLMEDGTGIPSPSKIKSFLGMVVFYQQYIEGCSRLGKPLLDLTSGMKKPRHGKGRRKPKADRQLTSADWTPECREAFNLLKQALLEKLTQGLQPSPQSEVHVLSRQELMEMQRADTCRVLFFVERQRRPSRREPTHEAVDVLRLLRHWERLSVKMGVLYHVSKNIISRKKSFQRCVFSKSPEPEARAPLESIITTRPLELVCIDFWSAEDSSKSVDVLVVTDHFTKLAQAYPCSNQLVKVVAWQLWNNFFCTYGFPDRVHSDQGANFESSLIAEMLQVVGIQKSHTTPYHPMGNGCVERFNRTLGNMIRALLPKAKHRWPQMLKALTFSYNSTVHETPGYAPFNLMFGRCPRLPVDLMFESVLQDEQVADYDAYVQALRHDLAEAVKIAQASAGKQQKRQANLYDRKLRGAPVDVGDRVLLANKGERGKRKLADRWEGHLYVVTEKNEGVHTFKIRNSETGVEKVVHRYLILPLNFLPVQDGSEVVSCETDITEDVEVPSEDIVEVD